MILKTKLEDTELQIERTICVPENITYAELAAVLISAYGGQGYHAYSFSTGKKEFDNENLKEMIKAVDLSRRLLFNYDFGDGWCFSVEKYVESGKYEVISGVGRGIIEDVGGTGGLERFVESFSDERMVETQEDDEEDWEEGQKDDRQTNCEWLGIDDYDAKTCEVDKINESLERYAAEMAIGYDGTERDIDKDLEDWFFKSFGYRLWM